MAGNIATASRTICSSVKPGFDLNTMLGELSHLVNDVLRSSQPLLRQDSEVGLFQFHAMD